MTLPKFLVLFVSSLSLAACGGGGSSSDGGSGSGGVGGGTSNAAPVVNISISDTSPNEGLTISLDASGSTDSDGDTLSFTWTQLSGPDLSFSATSGSEIAVTVPNLTADTSARVQLSVSDGAVATTDEVTLDLKNLVLNPIVEGLIVETVDVEYPGKLLKIESVYDSVFLLVNETASDLVAVDKLIREGTRNWTISERELISSEAGSNFSYSGTPVERSVFIGGRFLADYRSEAIDLYELNQESDGPRLSFDVDNACSIENDRDWGDHSFVGLKNGGLKVFEYFRDPNGKILSVTNTVSSPSGRSFCEMRDVFTSIKPGAPKRFPVHKLVAFDRNSNEIVTFNLEFEDEENLTNLTNLNEANSYPLNLDVPQGASLEFVHSIKIEFSDKAGMALVFTDGSTEGLHRLVIVGLDENEDVYQETYQWDYGTPKHIREILVDDHPGYSFMILTEDSPYAVIFDTPGVSSGSIPRDNYHLPLNEPKYFEVGVGAVDAASFGSLSGRGFIVGYAKENLIRVFVR